MSFLKGFKKRSKDSLFDNSSIKVILIGCIAIVISLLLMSTISILITSNAVVNKLKTNDLANLAESIGAVIEGKIDKAVDTSLIMANDPVMMRWIKAEEKDEVLSTLVRKKMKNLVREIGYDTTFLVSNVTKHYWSYHGDKFELLDTVARDDPSDDWFFDFIEMNKKYEINIDHNKELNDTFVWINTLVGNVNSPDAVTGLGMNLSQVIRELIQNEKNSKIKNDMWLMDEKGVIQLAKNPEYLGKNIKDYLPIALVHSIKNQTSSKEQFEIAEYKDARGEVFDIAYKIIKDTEWKLIVQIPRSESVSFLKAITLSTVITCILIVLVVVATFYALSNRIANPYKRALELNRELEKIVIKRTRELQEKNSKIQDSLEYAKMIQQTILPSTVEISKSMRDYFAIFQPRDIVGGDFYWMKRHDKGVLIVVGDCTGHGVPGALMTMAVNAILNHISDGICNDNPGAILKELDRLLKESLKKEGQADIIHDGLDAAVFYIPKEGIPVFSGANMSIFIADENNIQEIKGSAYTIDCLNRRREKHFSNHEVEYNEKNTFYIVTDGFKDQPGGDKKLSFGKKRFVALLDSVKHLEMNEQKVQIIKALEQYQGNEIRRDDITILGFKI